MCELLHTSLVVQKMMGTRRVTHARLSQLPGPGTGAEAAGARSFAFRPGFAPRVNRFAFARFNRFHRRRFFAFAAAPFVAGVGLYGGSCWSWQPTPWGWQRVWACDYDYGYY